MKIVYSCLVVLAVAATANAAPVKLETKSHDLFGSKLIVTAPAKLLSSINEEIKEKSEFYSGAYDPDCYYKANKFCGKSKLDSVELESITQFEKETDGNFVLAVKTDGGTKRDFGGVAQGAFLEKLARKFPTGWVGNFSGDIYIAPDTKLPDVVTISDALLPKTPFAVVDMKSGWITSGTSPDFGGSTHNVKPKYDFQKIVLFAKPEFSGARIDAWDTALIEGGVPLLTKLFNNPTYKGQWAYLYFDSNGKPVCASNIECDFEDANQRLVRVIWK